MFIRDFSSYLTQYVRIKQGRYLSPLPAAGFSLTITTWVVDSSVKAILGLTALIIDMDYSFGFESSYILDPNGVTVECVNKVAGSYPFELTFKIITFEELQCPNGELYVDSAVALCYTTCPPLTTPATVKLGLTNLTRCLTCASTCATCSTSTTACSSCYPAQNRQLVGTVCSPLPGFYNSGSDPIAQSCDLTKCS